MSSRGPGSIPVAIARLGFADPSRAKSLLDDPALADLIRSRDHIEAEGLAAALAEVPDPDGALLGLVRFMESVGREPGAARTGHRGAGRPRAGPPARARGARQLGGPRRPPVRPPRALVGGHRGDHAPRRRAGAPPRDGGDHPRAGPARRRAAHVPTASSCSASPPSTSPLPTPRSPCPRRPGRWPTSPRPRSRRRWPSPATRWGRMPTAPGSRWSRWARRGGCELNYISRRRRHLRRRAGRRGGRGGVDGHRDRPRDPADADLLGLDAGRVVVGGRPGAAPRGQERAAGAHRRQPPQLLRALGQDLGVPGPAQGARPWRATPLWDRRTATPCSRWCGRPRAARTSSTTCRRCAAGSSSTSPAPRPTGSSSSAPAGCVTSSSRCSCSSSCTAAPTSRCAPAPRSTGWRPCRPAATWGATTPRRSARPTGCCAPSSTASSCTGCGAPT